MGHFRLQKPGRGKVGESGAGAPRSVLSVVNSHADEDNGQARARQMDSESCLLR